MYKLLYSASSIYAIRNGMEIFMEGDIRREKIIELLNVSDNPLSGAELSRKLGVSRQVIVQDIALLRAVDKNILSTNKGYIMFGQGVSKAKKSFCVSHSDSDTEDELNTIVDYGGRIKDVVVEHDIYGQIMVDLIINDRSDVKEFMSKLNKNKTKPLKTLTDGIHYHTVEADTEEQLIRIEEELGKKGYLA